MAIFLIKIYCLIAVVVDVVVVLVVEEIDGKAASGTAVAEIYWITSLRLAFSFLY